MLRVLGSHALTSVLALLLLCRCGADPQITPLSFDLAILSISEGLSFDYGHVAVGEVVEHTFTVTNVGKERASGMRSNFHITAFQYWGGTYPGVGGTCDDRLEPDESCTVVIAFTPIHSSFYTTPIQIVYHNGAQEQITVRPVLRGTAVGP